MLSRHIPQHGCFSLHVQKLKLLFKMDAKALAKSKRAHSQHHSKRPHSNKTSKAPSAGNVGAGNAKKQPGKQIREKPHQSMGLSRLPSNWDRYEEEFDSGSEGPSINSTNQANDVIVPKSKGADYGELISEAISQSRSNPYFDSFASLDDVVPDFNQGVGSLLSVRGQGILSWIGDNNFIVEDRATTSHEAPFLSLNLHSLAEQLTKVDLSQRLFVEEDLLSPELMSVSSEGVKVSSNQEANQMQRTSEGAKIIVDESAVRSFPEKDKIVDKNKEVMSSDTTRIRNPVISSPNQSAKSENQVKDKAKQFGRAAQTRDLELAAQINKVSVADPEKKQSVFEAAAAEAELDMLLDSFNETNKFDSLGFKKSRNALPVFQQKPSMTPPQLSRKVVTANLDDALDDLLEETSNLMDQNGTKPPQQAKPTSPGIQCSSSSHSGQGSKVLDDFDSWLDTI
ncbi:unnamed protein product, partial [Vitis vinifera]